MLELGDYLLIGLAQFAARSEQVECHLYIAALAGKLTRGLQFAFRPPAGVVRLKTDIRTTARWSVSTGKTCLQSPGRATCVAYVDSRQSQAQLTMDTDFPPTMSAGLQMAYLVNEERQINRKTAQLVITAFVQLNTSVGQIR